MVQCNDAGRLRGEEILIPALGCGDARAIAVKRVKAPCHHLLSIGNRTGDGLWEGYHLGRHFITTQLTRELVLP